MSRDYKRTSIRLRCNQSRTFDFPGGSVEIARTSEGDYWAHISVETPRRCPSCTDEHGTVRASRIDRTDGAKVEELAAPATVEHVALRISTPKDGAR